MNETSAKTLASKYLMKSVKNHLHLKSRLYCFQLKTGVSISDHINAYAKLLAESANVNVVIEEDKFLILLSSLPDEGYETFVLILINERTSLKYCEVTTALVNLELR